MTTVAKALRVARRARRIPRAQWVAHWRTRPVEPDTVLYESTFGAGLIDSPYAVFRHLVESPDLGHLRHVWVVADADRRQRASEHLLALGLDEDRVRLVGYRTPGYFRHLATAGYLVGNATFPGEFGKRPGQTYVNTWHGTPLKSMGYDTPGGALDTANIVRNFLAADVLVSSGPFMTDTMYRTAYRLEGIAPGSVLEVGSPRTDVQVTADDDRRREIRARLRAGGVDVEEARRTVLVAPTWRGAEFGDPRFDADGIAELVALLRRELGTDWQVLVKAHPVVHGRARTHLALEDALVPADVPANEVLAISDHLVTDYSSILFDALATPRMPITFHVPDHAAYEQIRPLYVPAETLPGRVCTTASEVVDDVRAGGSHPGRREEWATRYAPFDDGQATRRLVDAVWRGREPEVGRRVSLSERTGPDGARVPRLLIHGGSLQRNGVTSSLIALLNHLDHEEVDVTVTWGPARRADPEAFAEAVGDRVRLMPRVGGLNGPKRVVWSRRLLERYGADSPLVPMEALVELMREEWVRCFGGASFDHVVDFGGYSPFWALLMSRGVARGPVRTHSIWLHNDLAAEVASSVGQDRAHHLRQVFSLYGRFDSLVSVSAGLSSVNEGSLSRYAGDAAFRSARNLIDDARVRFLAEVPLEEVGVSPVVLAALMDDGVTTFVTAGRLTREKHQARLIRAAAAARGAGHRVAVVVMGDGPLSGELDALVGELGVAESVFLTGHVANPFPVVAAADYFALTSEHEGLPMVILEALALSTPVLTTAFSSVEGVVPEGCGVVVPADDEAVARAMMDLVSTRPAFAAMDVDAYNATALREFASAIRLGDSVKPPIDRTP